MADPVTGAPSASNPSTPTVVGVNGFTYGFDPDTDVVLVPADSAPLPKPAAAADPSPPTPTPAPEPKKYQHATPVAEAALRCGWTKAELDATPPEQLAADVFRLTQELHRQQLEDAREAALARTQFDRPAPPQQQPTPAPEPKDPWEEEIDRDLAEYDDGIKSKFKKAARVRDDELKALREKVAALEEREVKRTQQSTFEVLDDAFATLGESAAAVFGGLTRAELVAEATEAHRGYLVRRGAVVQAAGLTNADAPAVVRRKIAAAARLLYGDAAFGARPPAESPADYASPSGQPAPRPAPPKDPGTGRFLPRGGAPAPTEEEWAAAGAAVPTQRATADLPPGPSKAERTAAKWMKEHGWQAE